MRDSFTAYFILPLILYQAIFIFYTFSKLKSKLFRMNVDTIDEKFRLYSAKLEATRRQLEVAKTSFFKAKTATTKIKWPQKPPTEKMRLLLRIVSG